MQRFGVSMDRLTRNLTWLFWGLMALGLAAALVGVAVGGPLVLPVLVVLVAAAAAVPALAPTGYAIDGDALVIERRWRPPRVPLAAIAGVRGVEAAELGGLVRTFGSGGAHGWFGRFRSMRLGRIEFQATRRDRMLLLERRDAPPLLLTPDDLAGMAAALRARLQSSARSG